MNETVEKIPDAEAGQKKLDEFGIDRTTFEMGQEDGKFLKLKDGDKMTVSFTKVRQIEKEFYKFENGQIVKDAQGNRILEKKGAALELTVDAIDGKKLEIEKVWEVSSKKTITSIFSFLDKREKDGRPYLFSRLFNLERKGKMKDTQYIFFPTDPKV